MGMALPFACMLCAGGARSQWEWDWKLEIAMPKRKITFPNQLSGASCHSKPGDSLIDKWKGRAIFDRHWHIPRALIQRYNLGDVVGLAGR